MSFSVLLKWKNHLLTPELEAAAAGLAESGALPAGLADFWAGFLGGAASFLPPSVLVVAALAGLAAALVEIAETSAFSAHSFTLRTKQSRLKYC